MDVRQVLLNGGLHVGYCGRFLGPSGEGWGSGNKGNKENFQWAMEQVSWLWAVCVCVFVCVTNSLWCTPETKTTKSTIL